MMCYRLTKAHHGTYLAEELTKTLKEFGIEKKACLILPPSSPIAAYRAA